MDIDNINQQLGKAIKSAKRPTASKFMDVLSSVEQSISSGVAHEEIVAILNENGFDLTLKSFRNALYRARQKVKNKPTEKLAPPSRPPAEKSTIKKPMHKSKKIEPVIDLKALSKLGANNK
tara:strand:+ start:3377 stop:3739 length:363 start_codon:yes stop_codon:yes gene_type:complete